MPVLMARAPMRNVAKTKTTAYCATAAVRKTDYLLWGGLAVTVVAYGAHWLVGQVLTAVPVVQQFAASVFTLINTMWVGIALGMLAVGLLGKVPREIVVALLGNRGLRGILRATCAGVLLDVCNHGTLLIGARLYERGVGIGQVMAFLIASPWNSLSLTFILIALIGLPWTLLFVLCSMVIAVITGLVFAVLEARGWIVSNPHCADFAEDFRLLPQARARLKAFRPSVAWFASVLSESVRASRSVVRWILFGVVVAALVQTFVNTAHWQHYFGPTMIGLLLTLGAASVMEVCSEGMAPLASDLFHRARAPGNGFLFLMAGAATDYTEILVLKNVTRSLRIALLLPVVTVPQTVLLAWLMNQQSLAETF